jgi:hypothetical protein
LEKLFIFGLKLLVHERTKAFEIEDGAAAVIKFLKRQGDDVALAVLGRAKREVQAIEFLSAQSIKFPSIITGEDHEALENWMGTLVRHHQARQSFCVHYDPAVLAIARRAGAKRIAIRNPKLTDVESIESLVDIIQNYGKL